MCDNVCVCVVAEVTSSYMHLRRLLSVYAYVYVCVYLCVFFSVFSCFNHRPICVYSSLQRQRAAFINPERMGMVSAEVAASSAPVVREYVCECVYVCICE
jgi:hypothetical protein